LNEEWNNDGFSFSSNPKHILGQYKDAFSLSVCKIWGYVEFTFDVIADCVLLKQK